jgi:hypothetical protein
MFWNMPTPPRTTARGPRKAPSKAPICGPVPYCHEKPTRGLTNSPFGTRSLRTPSRCSSSALRAGVSRNWLASRRTPYWICSVCDLRYESPSDSAPMSTSALRSRGDSVRVYDTGTPACRSASELYVKVPSRLTVWSCDEPSRRHFRAELETMLVVGAEPRERVHGHQARRALRGIQELIATEIEQLHAAGAVGEGGVHAHAAARGDSGRDRPAYWTRSARHSTLVSTPTPRTVK